MGKLTIQEVSKILVEKNGLEPEAARSFVEEFFDVILQQLQQGDQVKVKGLGTFKIINVEARESVSVRTGERVLIDSHSKVSFAPDTVMKELVNKPFSQFETVVLNEGVEFDDMKYDEPEEESLPAEEPKPAVAEEKPVVEEEKPAVAEEKPVVEEPKPAVEEEKPLAEEQQPEAVAAPFVVAEAPVAVSSSPAEEESTSDEDAEEEEKPWLRWLLMALGILLLMALAAWGGYQYGAKQHPFVADTIVVTDTVYMAEEDSANQEDVLMTEAEPQAAAAETVKPAAASEEVKEKPAAEVLDKWSAKDDRVRLGAYRIVGTKEEVVVQAGQTFYSICRAHLGPDMQCYVEVYNNLPSNPQIKEGQVIKIPKLELKKRRR